MTDFSTLLQQGVANAWLFIPSAILLGALHGLEPGHSKSKRAARTVLTGMCYSVGSATRQGSSSLTRFIGQSAMTLRT